MLLTGTPTPGKKWPTIWKGCRGGARELRWSESRCVRPDVSRGFKSWSSQSLLRRCSPLTSNARVATAQKENLVSTSPVWSKRHFLKSDWISWIKTERATTGQCEVLLMKKVYEGGQVSRIDVPPSRIVNAWTGQRLPAGTPTLAKIFD